MNPTFLRRFAKRYGNVGLLFVGTYLLVWHVWTKKRAFLVIGFLGLLSGCYTYNHFYRSTPAVKPIPVQTKRCVTVTWYIKNCTYVISPNSKSREPTEYKITLTEPEQIHSLLALLSRSKKRDESFVRDVRDAIEEEPVETITVDCRGNMHKGSNITTDGFVEQLDADTLIEFWSYCDAIYRQTPEGIRRTQ